MLDVIGFQDTSYDSLWQDILDKIELHDDKQEKQFIEKGEKKADTDDEFRLTVDKIIKENEEY